MEFNVLGAFGTLMSIASDLSSGIEKIIELDPATQKVLNTGYHHNITLGGQSFNLSGTTILASTPLPQATIEHESAVTVLQALISDVLAVEYSPLGTKVPNYYSFKLSDGEYANLTLEFTRVS